ncbi:unnamed protein product [Musa textilis]
MTGKKTVYFEASEEERSLASSFILATKENRLMEILDDQVFFMLTQVRNEGDIELIQRISELTEQCLNFRGARKVSVKEVAEELDRLKELKQHPWVPRNGEKIESSLGEPSGERGIDTITCYNSGKRLASNIESGR